MSGTWRQGGWALAGLSLLLACYVGSNPPGLAPDEPAHYRRAVGLASGVVLGEEAAYVAAYNVSPSQLAWLNRTSRAVPVPRHLRGCGIFRVPVAGRCPLDDRERTATGALPAGSELTYVGTYPPFAYLPPALAIRLADTAGFAGTGALLAGRTVVAAWCAALVAAAGALRRRDDTDPAGLVGLASVAIAVTPLAAFLFAELSGNGPEVAGAIATTAALLALTRDGPAPRGAVVIFGAAGLVLATSRSTGPLYLAEIALLVALLRGRAAAAILRRRGVLVAAAVGGAGVVASVAWQLFVEPRPARTLGSVLAGVPRALATLDTVMLQAAGVLGWRDVGIPFAAKAVWLLLFGGFAGLALLVGGRAARRALACAGVLLVATVVVIFAGVILPTSPDFDMQGRYVLALVVAIPLVAGEVVSEHGSRVSRLLRRPAARVAGPVLLAAAGLHVVGVVVNLRYYASSLTFLAEVPGGWLPIGGPLPWLGLLLVAAGCAVVAALPARKADATAALEPRTQGGSPAAR